MEQIFAMYSSIWGFFDGVTVPGLGISFASLYLGIFVVSVSIMVLRPLLGIGAQVSADLVRGVSSARSSSYKSYAKNRDRQKAYASRYRQENGRGE